MEDNRVGIGLREVAEACGVSLMTVSRAFREDSAIREETRGRILRKAEELGYLHSSRRGRPRARREVSADQIQLVFGNLDGNMRYFHTRLLTALEQQLAEAGCECIIRTCNGNYDIFVRLIERVRNDRSKATIILGSFLPGQLEQLLTASPGALLLDNTASPSFGGQYSSFSFDNRRAAVLATTHLLQCGRRRILLVCGPAEHFFSQELAAGYRDALAARGVPFEPRRVLHADFSAQGAAVVLRQAMEEGVRFDAVFTNDEMATGVYRVLHEAGMAIPGDVAVCGCDNLPLGEQLYPALSTIALDSQELASCAVRHICSGRSASFFPAVRLPPVLLAKASTGAQE